MRTNSSMVLQHRARCLFVTLAAASIGLFCGSSTAATLDRIRSTGHIKLGFVDDARPFSFKSDARTPDGYTIAVCRKVADAIAKDLALAGLTVDWHEVAFERRLAAVRDGEVDILCTPSSVTLASREQVSFSLPVFAGGTRAIVRADAPAALRRVLSDSTGETRAVWRGTPAATALGKSTLAVVSGTSSAQWVAERRNTLQLETRVVEVEDYRKGLQQLLDRRAHILFGDRVLALGALGAMDAAARNDIVILDRLFTHEPAALALARDDEDFRLIVDRALGSLYKTAEFSQIYSRWCGELDERTKTFFVWNTPVR